MLKVIPGWGLDVDRGPNCLLVKIRRPRGRAGDAPPLAEVLWAILEQHFTYRLVVELDQIKTLDDEILGQLLLLHDRIAEHGGLMRICGLSPRGRRLLLDRQLDDRLVPYQDREEAVMASTILRHPR